MVFFCFFVLKMVGNGIKEPKKTHSVSESLINKYVPFKQLMYVWQKTIVGQALLTQLNI